MENSVVEIPAAVAVEAELDAEATPYYYVHRSTLDEEQLGVRK